MAATFTLAVLLAGIVAAEWLARNTALRHVGAALLVILFAAVLANTGVIPSASNAPPLYTGIFRHVAPLAIFLLLLQVHLGALRQAGVPMLLAFALGSAGTVAGVLAGLWLTSLREHLGDMTPALGGMFAATYTGGSINFNAVALHYKVNEQGALYAGALAVDNIMTMVWMVVTLLIPRVFGGLAHRGGDAAVSKQAEKRESVSVTGLATILGLAAASMWLASVIAEWTAARGLRIPSVLVLTTLALLLAQFDFVRRIGGTHVIGMLAVHLFLAVIGAHAELSALGSIGALAPVLLAFVSVLLLVHGAIILAGGWLLRDWALVAIASQANIGGATTAMALAEAFDREDLLLPAILVGALGTASGTYIGFTVAGIL